MEDREFMAEVEEILQKAVADMTYDDLVKVTMAYMDDEARERWDRQGLFTEMSNECKRRFGVEYPIKQDAPDKVKEAYKRLGEMERKASEEEVILY